MEHETDIRTELRELTDSASLLLDDRTYNESSCNRLIEAIGLAKVALQNWKADDETLQRAYDGLCEAVDGLQTVEEPSSERPKGRKRKNESGHPRKSDLSWRKAAPYLICGAAIVGSAAYLVASISRSGKTGGRSLADRIKRKS